MLTQMQNTLNHLDIFAMKMAVLHIERVAASAHNTANSQLYKSDNDSDSNSRELKMLKLLPFLPVTQHFKQMQFRSFKLQLCLRFNSASLTCIRIIKNQSSHIIIRFICDIISLCNIVRRTCMTYLILQSGICLPYSSSNSQRSICNSAEMYYM